MVGYSVACVYIKYTETGVINSKLFAYYAILLTVYNKLSYFSVGVYVKLFWNDLTALIKTMDE